MNKVEIIIPMAGKEDPGFAVNGFTKPKPFIHVGDEPMISFVIQVQPKTPCKFTLIARTEHVKEYNLKNILDNLNIEFDIVTVDTVTEGPACSVIRAMEHLDKSATILIANSDQFIEYDINKFLQEAENKCSYGHIMTMKADDPKWSYIKYNNNNMVTAVKEKEVISDEATVGIYQFKELENLSKIRERNVRQ